MTEKIDFNENFTLMNTLEIAKPYELSHTMTFHDNDGKEIGRLDWRFGSLTFSGELDESAKVFLGFLKQYLDPYIQEQLAKHSLPEREEGK